MCLGTELSMCGVLICGFLLTVVPKWMGNSGGHGVEQSLLQSSHRVNEIAEVTGNLPQVSGAGGRHRLQGL